MFRSWREYMMKNQRSYCNPTVRVKSSSCSENMSLSGILRHYGNLKALWDTDDPEPFYLAEEQED